MGITGKTAIVLMLADPVAHIRGTELINRSLAELGLDAVVAPLHVKAQDLALCLNAVRRMHNVVGLGITIPHKIGILPLLDSRTETAVRLGAANWVRRNPDGTLTGHNIDGAGFVAGLEAANFSPAERRALVIGAGGVGRAIAFALADAGASAVTIANRNVAAARQLADDIAAVMPNCRVRALELAQTGSLEEHDLVVNATSVGMDESDRSPISLDGLATHATVAEVIVNPPLTPLLQEAARRGCRIVAGSEMLKPQPRLAAEFFGLLPPARKRENPDADHRRNRIVLCRWLTRRAFQVADAVQRLLRVQGT